MSSVRVAERLLQVEPGRRVVRHRRHRAPPAAPAGPAASTASAFSQASYGCSAASLLLDLVVADDAALFEVDQQHLAGLQPPFADDLLLRHRQYAGLRGHDHMVVVGDDVARRPEAVAVERGADLAAVGEGDRRRPVPRLHQRRMVLVEGAPLRVHQRVADHASGISIIIACASE